MNTYCEILPSKNYSLQEIPADKLQRLASLLNQVNDTELSDITTAILRELQKHVPPFFAEAGQRIVFCDKCGSVGYNKNEDTIIHGKHKIDVCPVCNGEGSRVKKYFILYEPIDENKRRRFAREDYKYQYQAAE